MVVLMVDKMNRAATLRRPARQDGVVDMVAEHSLAAELGQERGVNIENACFVANRVAPEAEKPAHDDQLDTGPIERRGECVRERAIVRKVARADDFEREPGSSRNFDAADRRAGAYNHRDSYAAERLARNQADEIIERASAAGDQYADPQLTGVCLHRSGAPAQGVRRCPSGGDRSPLE